MYTGMLFRLRKNPMKKSKNLLIQHIKRQIMFTFHKADVYPAKFKPSYLKTARLEWQWLDPSRLQSPHPQPPLSQGPDSEQPSWVQWEWIRYSLLYSLVVISPCNNGYQEEHEEPGWIQRLWGHEVHNQDIYKGEDDLEETKCSIIGCEIRT